MNSGSLNHQLQEDGILILCYHRISNDKLWTNKLALSLSNNEQLHEYSISKQELIYQIKYLKRHNIKIISLTTAVNMIKKRKPIKHKYVVITFDDVDETLIDNVYPLFEKLGNIPYTVFIVTSNTGRYDNGTHLATWNELNKIFYNSNVTVGIHTNNMHYLINNKPVLMQKGNYFKFVKDYHKSEKILKFHIGHTSPYFAYPYGEGTQKEQHYLVNHGIITFSLGNKVITANQNLSQPLPRILVDSDSWKKDIKKWVDTPN